MRSEPGFEREKLCHLCVKMILGRSQDYLDCIINRYLYIGPKSKWCRFCPFYVVCILTLRCHLPYRICIYQVDEGCVITVSPFSFQGPDNSLLICVLLCRLACKQIWRPYREVGILCSSGWQTFMRPSLFIISNSPVLRILIFFSRNQ